MRQLILKHFSQIHSDGQVNIDIHGIQTSLQPQDLTNVLLCPDAGKPLLFLYLSTIGCTSVLHLLQKIPGVFCSPFTGRGRPHSRRVVVCLSTDSKIEDQHESFLGGFVLHQIQKIKKEQV